MIPEVKSKKKRIADTEKRTLNCYLEVYIKENGSVILTPITNNTSLLVEALSKDSKSPKDSMNNYCG